MGAWKAVRPAPEAPIELYDLSRDIGESRDVAGKQREIVERMESVMRRAAGHHERE